MSGPAANHNEESFEFDCPECGTHITGEVDHCPKCGVEFVIEEVSETECPQCRAVISVESDKCPYCGLDILVPSEAEGKAAPAEEAPRAEVAPPQVPAEPEAPHEGERPAPPAPAEAPKEVPPPTLQDAVVTQDQLKEQFSVMVSKVKPLLTLAKDHSIDVVAARKLIDRAVEIGKSKDVEGAVRTLRECLTELRLALDEHLDSEIVSLEGLAEVVTRIGGDGEPILAAVGNIRQKRSEGDYEGAMTKVRAAKKFAEQLAGPYVAAHEMYGALEKLVQTSEALLHDVREERKLLGESKEAGENGDWSTMAALARKGRENLVQKLPDILKAEMHLSKQELMEAKMHGKDVAAGVKLLKDAGAALKLKRYEEALFILAQLKAGQKA